MPPEKSSTRQMANSLSICMVSDDFFPAATGVGIHVQCVAKELAQRGHRITIITTRRPGQPKIEVWNGVKVYRTFTIKVYGFYQALASRATLRRILKENEVDIVHYHYLGLLLMRAFKSARSLKVKHIYTYHMTVDHLTQPRLMKPFRQIIAGLYNGYCRKFNLILAPSERLAEQIRHSGIDTPTYFLSNPIVLNGAIDTENPRSGNGFVVLYVGRLDPEKNLPYLLKAFAALVKKHENAELWLVGQGGLRKSLEDLCGELGVAASVKFLGFVNHEDLPQYYSATDVFVLPSLVETQGMTAMEAMCFAKPIIVTKSIVSAQELVEDGENGFIVDPGSVDDLTDKLLRLSEDPDLRRNMGRQSYHRSRRYSPEKIVTDLEQYYARVAHIT